MIGYSDVVAAFYSHLKKINVPFFQFVPQKQSPPYGVLKVTALDQGNGLPAPHFYTEGFMEIHLWSAYEGIGPLDLLMKEVEAAISGVRLPCKGGTISAFVEGQALSVQLVDRAHKWREGILTVRFYYDNKKE